MPLHADAHDALRRWYAARPDAASDALFVSLRQRRSATSETLSASAVGDVVAKYAAAAGVREDRRTAHALRHSRGSVRLRLIRELTRDLTVPSTRAGLSGRSNARG